MRPFAIPALCLLAIAAIIVAQDQPTIRVTTRLVQVSVVVHDKKGEPVADLKKEDFSVFDKGKEQKIAVFAADVSGIPVNGAPKLPPNIFSNRVQTAATPTSITVVLFDGLNTKITDQAFARKQLLTFLRTLKPNEQIALYLLGSDLRIIHDFTNDPDHLAKLLAKFQGRNSPELAAADPDPQASTGNDDLDQFLSNADRVVSDFYNVNRAKWTLDAMEAIAHHLASLPGRKNLVWISGGFTFTLGLEPEDFSLDASKYEHRTFSEETTRVARAMNDANIAIYPVDARGLMTMAPSASAPSRTTATGGSRMTPRPPSIKSTVPANIDTMQILAERTGGHAFYNTNDLAKAVETAVNDARVTYTLGFYPDSSDWDGKFHEIKVKVDRGGVDVRFRKGFVAFTDHTPNPKELQGELSNALSSPIEATGIGVNARADKVDKPKPGCIQITLQITADDVFLQQKGDRWVGSVGVIFAQYGPDGKGLSSANNTLALNLTQPKYDEAKKRGLLVGSTIEPVANADFMRIVVLDEATGNVGSLRVPMK